MAVTAVAFATQAPQLGVAEFAPAAKAVVESPPTTGDGARGRGASRGGRRGATTTTTAPTSTTAAPGASGSAAPTTRVGRSRQCYGNPPRQIEDPMAPPCAATIFEGDNGGVTAMGVTSTEIRVAVPMMFSYADWLEKPIEAMIAYLNDHFEFYGRRLVPVYTITGTDQDGSAVRSRAHAADIASRNVFGAVTGVPEWASYAPQAALPDELARRGIITVVRGASSWWADRTLYDPHHPYLWSVYPSLEDYQRNLADFICTSLAGHNASRAGDAALRTKTRKFGVVSVGRGSAPSVNELTRRLADCTGTEPLRYSQTLATSFSEVRTALQRMKNEGATTLMCICEDFLGMSAMTSYPSAIGFSPEWILTPVSWEAGNDEGWMQAAVTAGQIAPPIRFSAGPRLLPLQARPWFPAVQSLLTGPNPNLSWTTQTAEFVYPELLVLASGIQAAGPALTPETFAAGLMSIDFPNPGAGQPPYWQPSAGFGPGDHSFYDDYNVGWWSDSAVAFDLGTTRRPNGSWCYLHQAARFTLGTYPADADQLLFNPDVPCR